MGTAGGLLDAHFLQAWLRLMKAGSKRTHYVLLVEREVREGGEMGKGRGVGGGGGGRDVRKERFRW